MDGMPEPPRRALDDDSQSHDATIVHLLGLEDAAIERGDLERANELRPIVESYEARGRTHARGDD